MLRGLFMVRATFYFFTYMFTFRYSECVVWICLFHKEPFSTVSVLNEQKCNVLRV